MKVLLVLEYEVDDPREAMSLHEGVALVNEHDARPIQMHIVTEEHALKILSVIAGAR